MKKLSIDIETFSDIDLIKCGVYKYADSPAFEILLFAYSIDDGEINIIDLVNGEELPEEIAEAIKSDTVIKTAFNAQFERVCLSKHLGILLDPSSWYCTAVQAAELSLPSSLADVGAALGLERQKMTEGKELIKYFCVSCKPTKSNGGRTRNMPGDAPEKWALFSTAMEYAEGACSFLFQLRSGRCLRNTAKEMLMLRDRLQKSLRCIPSVSQSIGYMYSTRE